MRVRLGIVAAFCLSVATLGALWVSLPPDVATKQDPPFVAVVSPAADGSLWLDVKTASVIAMTAPGDRIELTMEISGVEGSTVSLILGGSFVDADPNCSGIAFSMEELILTEDDAEWDALVAYMQRRPGTGVIFDKVSVSTIDREKVESALSATDLFGSRGVVLTGATTKSWQADESSEETQFNLASAKVTCSFSRSALVDQWLYRHRFRAPDLVVAQAGQSGDDLLKVQYNFDARASEPTSSSRSTFDESPSRVDAGGDVITAYADDWWRRFSTERDGITISGGTVVWEPQQAQDFRNGARLAAGMLASLGVAVTVAVVAYLVGRSRWATR
ncbi:MULTISPECIES: hypothetical protein [unclassified Microbacterium]|uniref:hypothetical protein n=1 Tax=unclassified Microbacterium TaxID=2609290 RepID=UPI000A467D3F|nr:MULTISPECIES: hypothetical protein [unclassified Microbacterium]MBN9225456.1 hypothetical protein [Microbacterium sp.]